MITSREIQRRRLANDINSRARRYRILFFGALSEQRITKTFILTNNPCMGSSRQEEKSRTLFWPPSISCGIRKRTKTVMHIILYNNYYYNYSHSLENTFID